MIDKERVELRLAEVGLSASAASTVAGLDEGFIRDILRDKKRSISADNLERLAQVLKCEPRYLTCQTIADTEARAADMTRFGSRLARARKASDLSQTDLAKRIDVTPSAVSQWEGEIHSPSSAKLRQIAFVTGFNIEWLANGVGPVRNKAVRPTRHGVTAAMIVAGLEAFSEINRELSRLIPDVVKVKLLERAYVAMDMARHGVVTADDGSEEANAMGHPPVHRPS